MTRQTYTYRWKNNSKRETLYGRECVIITTGPACSALIEFTDNGQQEITSRRALRKVKRS